MDDRSGIRIVWGAMDSEFSADWCEELLLGWLGDMKDKSQRYFNEIESGLRSEGLGADSLRVMTSLDIALEDEKLQDQNQKMFGGIGITSPSVQKSSEFTDRQSLREQIKSNRKKPSAS